METEDLVQLMKEKASMAGTVVRDISSIDEAIQYTLDLCREKGMKSLTGIDLKQTDIDLLSDSCIKEGVELLSPPLRDNVDRIDLALTLADFGIADTGTIMVRSDSEETRIATMMSTIHVAVLPSSKIRKDSAGIEPDLDAVLKSDSASYTAFITGPSRTADIERVLAIGVHGPLELHLLIIGEDAA